MTNTQKLIARCKELGINSESLTNNAQREAAIAAEEAKTAQDEGTTDATAKAATEASEEGTTDASVEVTAEVAKKSSKKVPTYKDERGRKWSFKATAPKTINIDGHPMSQEDIFSSEDVISELVYGNSAFLTQIHE